MSAAQSARRRRAETEETNTADMVEGETDHPNRRIFSSSAIIIFRSGNASGVLAKKDTENPHFLPFIYSLSSILGGAGIRCRLYLISAASAKRLAFCRGCKHSVG